MAGHNPMRKLLEHAKEYQKKGLAIVPVKGKMCMVSWRPYQTRQPSEEELEGFFGPKSKATGLAVILGKVSGGIVCRDFDSEISFSKWAEEYPALANILPSVKTPKGFHVYFRSSNPSLTDAYIEYRDGEYRGDSFHYTVLPPSIHPSGDTYEWLTPFSEALPALDPNEKGLAQDYTEDTDDSDDSATPTSSKRPVSICVNPSLCVKPLAICVNLENPRIRHAIECTQPRCHGQRNRMIFQLVRELKAIPELAAADARDLMPILKEWHRQALSHIATKPIEESMHEFHCAWLKVRYPSGSGPIEAAFERALGNTDLETAKDFDQLEFKVLVALCAELQRDAGDFPFFLACRTAGNLLGVSHTQANRWLCLLEKQKTLLRVARGSLINHRANEYRFIVPLV